MLIKLLTVEKRERRERERERRDSSDFSGCLAIATVGQKAKVGQGLPNYTVKFLTSQPFLGQYGFHRRGRETYVTEIVLGEK